ncbi:unnamed protein product [Laminaria digitata]
MCGWRRRCRDGEEWGVSRGSELARDGGVLEYTAPHLAPGYIGLLEKASGDVWVETGGGKAGRKGEVPRGGYAMIAQSAAPLSSLRGTQLQSSPLIRRYG